jgi:hypothetical protein
MTYNGTVSDLDRLSEVEQERSSLSGEQKARAMDDVVVDFPCEVAGVQRGCQVRDDTGKTEVESLLGNFIEGEGILDDFLYRFH